VAKYGLRAHIQLDTAVTEARFDDAAGLWTLRTSRGETMRARAVLFGVGGLVDPKSPDIPGLDGFAGRLMHTARWDHDYDLAGKRVAVIGTGSSGIQSIPMIAEQASQLTVFQRTPNFALPAHNGPTPADRLGLLEGDRATYREQARWSLAGVPYPQQMAVSWQLSEAERRARFEEAWAKGDLVYILTQLWADQAVDVDGNARLAELVREKIREVVKDPEIAAALTPHDHPFGAKRPCLDTNYYAT
jgi:cation diffusion facilitator CzcD-associated flavoprotein CzcO